MRPSPAPGAPPPTAPPGPSPDAAAPPDVPMQWRTLFDAVPVGLLVLDAASPLRFLAFNDRAAEQLGHDRESFAREDLATLDAQRSPEQVLARSRDVYALQAGTRFETPVRQRHRDAGVREMLATVLRVDAGERRLVVAAFVDLTERLRAERALREADQRKDEFQAMLAHELRNPLAPLRTALRVLERGELDARSRSMVEMCERQVRHLGRLVDDLLEVSRISRGLIELRRERILVVRAVASVVEALGPALAERDQRVELDLPREALWAELDPVRFAQILENLITNASKYSDPGARVTVRVAARGHALVLEVSDTGIGLAAADLERVFEMFTQLTTTIDRARGGLGIGLALVRRLAEAHGGTARASSPGPGGGSTFTVELPIGREPAARGQA